ncbi:MAG: tetratricopeptide repeat protein [Alphaproteobacteria bacterium]|nr:tetratricopeptide repeat protein [Alphaproteobacteria bacterium]
MAKDLHDLEVTTARAETVAAYNVFATDWIGYGPRVRSIFAAADDDADCALVNAHAAAVHMALEAAPGFKKARGYLRRARKVLPGATAREQAFLTAVNDWWRGNVPAALQRLKTVVAQHPADIVSAKWAQYLAFNLGDAPVMLEVAKAVLPAHSETASAWSMLAFAHEQNNAIGVAEEAAYRALAINAQDPWAHHAIAHVMDTRGKVDDGVAFMTKHSAGWADRSIFVREHNYWHLALFHIDRKEYARALEIFDKHLWGEWREFAQEQIGAISALWRLEMRGADVGARFEPIVEKVIERWHEHILPFNDLHFIYALARGGQMQQAQEFLASMKRHGAQDVSGVWESVAIPCAEGLIAYAYGRFAAAADAIGPVLPRLHLIGGSHAQRNVFVQTWTDAARRAGQHSAVSEVLARRQGEQLIGVAA